MAKSAQAFRTIREVADWLGVAAHVLRFWESKFTQIKPVKRAGGRRYYRPSDMELVGGIKVLLHDRGLTIRGVQKMISEDGVAAVAALSPPLDSEEQDQGDVVSIEADETWEAEANASAATEATADEANADAALMAPSDEPEVAETPDASTSPAAMGSETPGQSDPEPAADLETVATGDTEPLDAGASGDDAVIREFDFEAEPAPPNDARAGDGQPGDDAIAAPTDAAQTADAENAPAPDTATPDQPAETVVAAESPDAPSSAPASAPAAPTPPVTAEPVADLGAADVTTPPIEATPPAAIPPLVWSAANPAEGAMGRLAGLHPLTPEQADHLRPHFEALYALAERMGTEVSPY